MAASQVHPRTWLASAESPCKASLSLCKALLCELCAATVADRDDEPEIRQRIISALEVCVPALSARLLCIAFLAWMRILALAVPHHRVQLLKYKSDCDAMVHPPS